MSNFFHLNQFGLSDLDMTWVVVEQMGGTNLALGSRYEMFFRISFYVPCFKSGIWKI